MEDANSIVPPLQIHILKAPQATTQVVLVDEVDASHTPQALTGHHRRRPRQLRRLDSDFLFLPPDPLSGHQPLSKLGEDFLEY